MNKYQLLDDAICDFFSAGMRGSPCINDKLLLLAADALSTPDLAHIDQRCWRLIARRMQAMRKAGRTKYFRASKGLPAHWEVVAASSKHEAREQAILP